MIEAPLASVGYEARDARVKNAGVRVALIIGAALLAAIVCDTLLFRVGLYVPLLDPSSTAGAFERALIDANGARRRSERARDR